MSNPTEARGLPPLHPFAHLWLDGELHHLYHRINRTVLEPYDILAEAAEQIISSAEAGQLGEGLIHPQWEIRRRTGMSIFWGSLDKVEPDSPLALLLVVFEELVRFREDRLNADWRPDALSDALANYLQREGFQLQSDEQAPPRGECAPSPPGRKPKSQSNDRAFADNWQRAKGAGITFKQFCTDAKIPTVKEGKRTLDRARKKRKN